MKSLARWSIDNRVTVNLIMIFIFAAGILTVTRMRREIYPQYDLDMINVSVVYPGASPEEVEEGICTRIEERLKGIEGISKVLSTSIEGMGSVTLELYTDADIDSVLDDVKNEIDRIDTFPEDSEEPIVSEISHRDQVITVAVFGDASEKALRQRAETIRDELLDLGKVSLAELVGVRNYEIAVEVSEGQLRRYGISFDTVVQAVKTGSVEFPGGVIKTPQGEILVRSKGKRYTGREFEEIPLIALADGTVLKLGQVAGVIDGFEDRDIRARFNGKPAALIQVNRTTDEDMIEIARAVREYVDRIPQDRSSGIQIATWFDTSNMVQDRINLLLYNGTWGIILVFIMLAIFLNLRLAFWVALGIPISFMGAFLVLGWIGATINMISLFAFIMTLGILVDDAIIVGENIYSHYGRGKSVRESIVEGLSEVGVPVFMAVSTTIVAFLPLMFTAGIMGKFIAIMPQAVIIILAISLFEALIILPAHLFQALSVTRRGKTFRELPKRTFRLRIEGGLSWIIERGYRPAIGSVVRNRYLAFAIGIGVLIISLGVIVGGYVPFVFFEKGESDWIIAEVVYPLGTPLELTQETIEQLEQQAFSLNSEFGEQIGESENLITNIFSLVGVIPRRDWKPGEVGAHVGEVWIELISSEQRSQLSVNTVISRWRDAVGEIPGVEQLSFFTIDGGPAGNPIEIQLAGKDFNRLRTAADELKSELRTYPGAFDITDDFKSGKPEKKLSIREGARSLKVTMLDLARQLRQAFYGEEALRIQRGKDDIKVMVRYAEKDRKSVGSLEQMRIRTFDGREIPIEEVARIEEGHAYAAIRHVNRKRVITVISDIDEARANASRIVADLNREFLPDLMKRYPGMRYDLEGQEKRTRETIDSLIRGFSLALMGIYLLLANQFRSYAQPLVIMIAIPFGLIGAVAGHFILGMQITIVSLFGIVALAGIVVNDSLILIDFINRKVREGMPVETAVMESGAARFRPVLLTSVTTVAGLFPLLLERSFQAQFLIPMAVSICFGLVAATALTLLYVPALYLILVDIQKLFFRR